jgi:hypothetical protein
MICSCCHADQKLLWEGLYMVAMIMTLSYFDLIFIYDLVDLYLR